MYRGESCLSWDYIAAFAEITPKFQPTPTNKANTQSPTSHPGIMAAAFVDQMKQGELSSWFLLSSCFGLAVSDPRDKIYAIFRLFSGDDHAPRAQYLPMADYALSKKEIYLRATLVSIKSSKDLYIVKIAQCPCPMARYGFDEVNNTFVDLEDFPSWVPRYDLGLDPDGGTPSTLQRRHGADCGWPHRTILDEKDIHVIYIEGLQVSATYVSDGLFDNRTRTNKRIPKEFRIAFSFLELWNESAPTQWTEQFVREMALTYLMGEQSGRSGPDG